MGHGASRRKRFRSRFQLHLFFAGVQRPRYKTDGCGRAVDAWRQMNAFEVAEGDEGGLVLLYDSNERTRQTAQQWLNVYGYTDILANGLIDSRISPPTWRFEDPTDCEACKGIMRDIVSDPEFLRYFANFDVIGPDGGQFGLASTFCVPEDVEK